MRELSLVIIRSRIEMFKKMIVLLALGIFMDKHAFHVYQTANINAIMICLQEWFKPMM